MSTVEGRKARGELFWFAYICGAMVAYGGALFLVLLAWLDKTNRCDNGPCAHDTGATVQLIIAVVGLIPLTAAIIALGVGHRRQATVYSWLTLAIYVAWWIVIGTPVPR